MTHAYLQVAILTILFSTTVVDRLFVRRTDSKIAKHVLWVLLGLGFVGGVLNTVLHSNTKARDGKIEGALEEFESGRALYLNNIADRGPKLEECLDPLSKSLAVLQASDSHLTHQVYALAIMGCAREVMAYGERGSVYWIESRAICHARVSEGTSIGPPRHRNVSSLIRCTDIQRPNQWELARESYERLLSLLSIVYDDSPRILDPSQTGALAVGARAAAYFFLCDYLFGHHDESLDKARTAIRVVLRATSPDASVPMTYRYEDATKILEFINNLSNSAPPTDCPYPGIP